jgi:hypothetical protein
MTVSSISHQLPRTVSSYQQPHLLYLLKQHTHIPPIQAKLKEVNHFSEADQILIFSDWLERDEEARTAFISSILETFPQEKFPHFFSEVCELGHASFVRALVQSNHFPKIQHKDLTQVINTATFRGNRSVLEALSSAPLTEEQFDFDSLTTILSWAYAFRIFASNPAFRAALKTKTATLLAGAGIWLALLPQGTLLGFAMTTLSVSYLGYKYLNS